MTKDNEQDKRIAALEGRVAGLEKSLQQLAAQRDMEAPAWAKPALDYYGQFIDTKTGSLDFWRTLTIMHRREVGRIVAPETKPDDRKGGD